MPVVGNRCEANLLQCQATAKLREIPENMFAGCDGVGGRREERGRSADEGRRLGVERLTIGDGATLQSSATSGSGAPVDCQRLPPGELETRQQHEVAW